jgi:hypothetical protein
MQSCVQTEVPPKKKVGSEKNTADPISAM